MSFFCCLLFVSLLPLRPIVPEEHADDISAARGDVRATVLTFFPEESLATIILREASAKPLFVSDLCLRSYQHHKWPLTTDR